MTVLDWADLTPAQVVSLISASSQSVQPGLEFLNFDLSVAEDVSGLMVASSSSVQWTGAATVHRGCSLSIASEIASDTSPLMRPYQVLTDQITGLSAKRYMGVFCPISDPDVALGQAVMLDLLSSAQQSTVSGQDRLYLLDRQIGYSYSVLAGANVLAAAAQAISDSGLTGVLADSTRSTATVPTDMAWAYVTAANTVTTTAFTLPSDVTAGSSNSTPTWLNVVNDLLGLINYRGVWCDETGMFRFVPYVDPSTVAPGYVFDADASDSIVGVSRTITRNRWKKPNEWVGVWQNDPSGTPSLYQLDNLDVGPSSQSARNGLVWSSQLQISASTVADFQSQVLAQKAADLRDGTVFKVTTGPLPSASHFDVVTYSDSRIGAPVKTQASSWSAPMVGGPVAWTLSQVGS